MGARQGPPVWRGSSCGQDPMRRRHNTRGSRLVVAAESALQVWALRQRRESPLSCEHFICGMRDLVDAPWRRGGLSCRDRSLLHLTIPTTTNRKRCRSFSFGEQCRTTPTARSDRVGEAALWDGYIATVTGREGTQGCSMTTLPMNPSTITNSSGTGTE